ncbi:MAG: hypothetical protein HW413_3073, partial [Thermoleophilia bacterium]|nr:hypothetical protein [Thermoleophilia bacterium]
AAAAAAETAQADEAPAVETETAE